MVGDWIYIVDTGFNGLLTAVFESYLRRERPVVLVRDAGMQPSLFTDNVVCIHTDEAKAERVWRHLAGKMSASALSALVTSYLCDSESVDNQLFRIICRVVDSPPDSGVERDFSDSDIVDMLRNSRKVRYEVHRLAQFARFQKASDGTYFAMLEPLYDVLPMVIEHFSDRFSDSRFIVYDRLRDYGFTFDGVSARHMTLDNVSYLMPDGQLPDSVKDGEEDLMQSLWLTYFDAIAIRERINPRKQRQDMPVRFWKYITEMRSRRHVDISD